MLDQSERRVLHGKPVPASDKLVSLFEPHADIIVKGARDVQYGHKLNLVTGKSGLILDIVIEAGNPADAERFLPMLDRHIARCGTPPRQMAADGGYASRDNLNEAKARGVTDVAFHKKRGLGVADMTKSAGSIASCATSAPASRPASPASSAPTAAPAAPGAASTTSRRMSGPPWWPTTWCCSPASDQPDACRSLKAGTGGAGRSRLRRLPLACRQPPAPQFVSAKRPKIAYIAQPSPANRLKNQRLWTGTRLTKLGARAPVARPRTVAVGITFSSEQGRGAVGGRPKMLGWVVCLERSAG